MRVAPRARALLAWFTWLLVPPLLLTMGCSSLLGLDEREDAVFALCQCQQVPELDDCHAVLSQRLSFAAPAVREAWLTFFEATCRDSCAEAYSCYAQPGTCSQLSCSSHDECCGHDPDMMAEQSAYCDLGAANPSCKSCSNTSCQQDTDCCGALRGEDVVCEPFTSTCTRSEDL